MKIIGGEKLQKEMYLRDQYREKFINEEKKIKSFFVDKYYRLKKKSNKFLFLWLYIFLGYIFILLLLRKEFDRDIVLTGSIIVGFLIFIFSAYPLYLFIEKKKFYAKWQEKEKDLLSIKRNAEEANERVAKLALAVICLSENYIELQEINQIHKLNKRWLELLGQYRDAINLLHHNKATADDYINYYREWGEKAK
ncbi:MAG TPA: DUF485 domain-containing protein [Acholeplasmataceae bacterium]|nr:DUF485 domain-containing protein [Acholeplasmataceae bacterium]